MTIIVGGLLDGAIITRGLQPSGPFTGKGVVVQGYGSTLVLSQGFNSGQPVTPTASSPAVVTQGWLRGPLVTQGYAISPPAPHLPADPTVVTMGYLGKPGAIIVQGYHLYVPVPPPSPDVYSDPVHATWFAATNNPVPVNATWAPKSVDPTQATWNVKKT